MCLNRDDLPGCDQGLRIGDPHPTQAEEGPLLECSSCRQERIVALAQEAARAVVREAARERTGLEPMGKSQATRPVNRQMARGSNALFDQSGCGLSEQEHNLSMPDRSRTARLAQPLMGAELAVAAEKNLLSNRLKIAASCQPSPMVYSQGWAGVRAAILL